jgi:hypothetical protein
MIVTTTIEQTIQPCRVADQKGGIDGMYNIFLQKKKGPKDKSNFEQFIRAKTRMKVCENLM